jgi:hypothetical protein
MKLRELFEAPQKRTAVVAFGRMNPPTIGHQKLVEALKSHNGDHYVFLSQTQKPKTDPLAFTDKLRYAKFFFPEITIGHPDVRTPMDMMAMLQNLGYTDIIYVAGSDRVEGFKKLFNDYNGKPDKSGNIGYSFDSIEVVSAGERDPDADGAEGMSASKMRAAAAEGNLEAFTEGTPRPEVAEEMFAAVRQGMGIKDVEPEMAEEAPPGREKQVKALKKEFPDDEGAPYAIAWAQHNKNGKPKKNESNLVLDKGRLRSHIISLIADKIAATDDIDQLAEWLKMIVGKELKPRGSRYQITSEDIVLALEACKSKRKKMRENNDLSYAIALAMQAKNLATGSVTGDDEMDVSVSLSPSAKKKMMQMKAQAEKISGMPFEKLVAMGEKQKAQDLSDISAEFNEETVELPDGETKTTKPDGSYIISGARGKEFFDKNGNLIKTHSPSINGLTLIKYPSGKGRYIYKAGGADTRGPLDGDKPGEADYIAYAFGGARFVFDARNGQPKISGSVEMGRLKVEFTGKVLDRPSFQKNVRQSMAEILGGDPLNILKDPMAAKPMVDKGTAKLYFDGKPIGAEQLAQVVQEL